MEKNILLTISYDGTCFSGWQRQPDRRTVQGELEKALSFVTGQKVEINGTSRTDAGVHAIGQRASFKGCFGIPTERIPLAVNNLLAGAQGSGYSCGDIRITAAEEMPADFHARFDSKGKTYRYLIRCGDHPDVFSRNYCCQIKQSLDIEAMRKAAALIEGTHDFACFQAAGGTPRETTVRTVYDLTIQETAPDTIAIEVTGDGFLYNMVRIIAGTLMEVGYGRKKPEEIADILASGDRQKAGHTAPPQGLYLVEIYYNEEMLKERQTQDDRYQASKD